MTGYPTADKYNEALQHPRTAFTDLDLRNGTVAISSLGLPLALGGGFAFTYAVTTARGKFAVRCFRKKTDSLEERYRKISAALSRLRDGPFVRFEFQPEGILVDGKQYPIVKMQWAEGHSLGAYLGDVFENKVAVEALAAETAKLQALLSGRGIAHGDIQNGNLVVDRQGAITLIDYDGMFVPGMATGQGTELGHKHWQHPRRSHADFGPGLDRFSFIVLKVSLAALARRKDLFDKYNNGENLLFTANDYADPAGSRLFRELKAIPEVARDVMAFAELCAASPDHIPDLAEFTRLVNPRAVPVTAPEAPKQPAGYIPALPVVPADDFALAVHYAGQKVEVVGRITEITTTLNGKTKTSTTLGLENLNGPGRIAVLIWPAALAEFTSIPDKYWESGWVSVKAKLDQPILPHRLKFVIGIHDASQLERISEMEAMFRLKAVTKLEQCELTGTRVPNTELATCAVTGKRVLRSQMQVCELTGELVVSTEMARSDYSGKVVRRGMLLKSEKPPGRLGLPSEFARCMVTGKRVLLDELGRSAISNKLVSRDLLIASVASGTLALADELICCEESRLKVLPSETDCCSVTGKRVDARLLTASKVSGRLALTRCLKRCAVTGTLALETELEQCRLTGSWVLPGQLATCAVTGVRALRSQMVVCELTNALVVPSEIIRSDYSGKMVRRGMLQASEKPPGRLGLPGEFGRCEVTGKRLLLDELGKSVVSDRQIDKELLRTSPRSGGLALADEMVRCQESGALLLPAEVGRCAITSRIVDLLLLSASQASGTSALTRLMQRCAVTNKLCLPSELVTCEATGVLALPGHTDVCSVTGRRVLRSQLVLCEKTRQLVLDTKAARSAVSGIRVRNDLLSPSDRPPHRLGLAEEFARCQVTGRRLLLDEIGVSAVSGKQVDLELLTRSARSGALALKEEMVVCEESGALILRTELCTCSVTGRRVNAQLLGWSEVSGNVVLRRLLHRCAVTGKLALAEELEPCQLSGVLALPEELRTCAVTGRRGVPGRFLRSDVSGKYVIAERAVRSAASGKVGLPNEVARCEWLEWPVLKTELKRCTLTQQPMADTQLNEEEELVPLRELLDGVSDEAERSDDLIPQIRRLDEPFFRNLQNVWVVRSLRGGRLAVCCEIHLWWGWQVRYVGFLLNVQGKFEIVGQGVIGYRGPDGWVQENELEFP